MIQMSERQPVETAELLAFTRIVELRSLSRAAADLAVPRATIGRRLRHLEQRLGVRLLRRTTRTLAVTDAGDQFYRHARIVLDAIGQAEASVRSSENVMRGHLRVSVPPLIDDSILELFTSFAAQHPEVRIQVDFTSRLVDLIRDGYDVALRGSADLQPGLVARTIARHKLVAAAAPKYLAEYGTPRAKRDLRRHRCLSGFTRGELPQQSWPLGRGGVQVDNVMSSNDMRLLQRAAIRGLGIALLPDLLIRDALATGELVQVLPGKLEVAVQFAVVYVERELLPLHVRAFVDALAEWATNFAKRTGLSKAVERKPKQRA